MYLYHVSSIVQEGYEYLPADVKISGDCTKEDSATLILEWKSYVLKWSFAKVTFSSLVKQI